MTDGAARHRGRKATGRYAPAIVPHPARSACEEHREWIEAEAQLERNAQSIYQDLVEQHGFTHSYNSVKRFVRTLKVREPERFDPSRDTVRLLEKVKKIGPRTAHLAQEIFARLGRSGQKAIYALSNLARHHKRE